MYFEQKLIEVKYQAIRNGPNKLSARTYADQCTHIVTAFAGELAARAIGISDPKPVMSAFHVITSRFNSLTDDCYLPDGSVDLGNIDRFNTVLSSAPVVLNRMYLPEVVDEAKLSLPGEDILYYVNKFNPNALFAIMQAIVPEASVKRVPKKQIIIETIQNTIRDDTHDYDDKMVAYISDRFANYDSTLPIDNLHNKIIQLALRIPNLNWQNKVIHLANLQRAQNQVPKKLNDPQFTTFDNMAITQHNEFARQKQKKKIAEYAEIMLLYKFMQDLQEVPLS